MEKLFRKSRTVGLFGTCVMVAVMGIYNILTGKDAYQFLGCLFMCPVAEYLYLFATKKKAKYIVYAVLFAILVVCFCFFSGM